MSLARIQVLFAKNNTRLSGVRAETPASLAKAEADLGCRLPDSMKWLLREHGYSQSCGLASLADAVQITRGLWTQEKLPKAWVVLDDRGDAGLVMLHASSGSVVWLATHQLPELGEANHAPSGADFFETYADWVEDQLISTDAEDD